MDSVGSMPKIRVFVADDHSILREGINALLGTSDGVEIVGEAANGIEAVESVRQLKPDVVIMDIEMPALDGVEATRRIRRQSPKTRILILTKHEERDYVLASIRAGASGYMTKRGLSSDLMKAIHAVHRGDFYLYPPIAYTLIEDFVCRKGLEEANDPYERLTDRERDVLRLLAEGCTVQEISDSLMTGTKTIIAHRAALMEKLGIRTRTELVKYAVRKGLVEVSAEPQPEDYSPPDEVGAVDAG